MYLGIDCGTQGTKALLVDEVGKAIGRGYAPHALVEEASGAREQEPRWWVEAMVAAVTMALAGRGEQVKAIGVSGQQHGLVVLDEGMEVIRPAKLWNDTSTQPQNSELIRQMGGAEVWFERVGIVPLTGYTISKLMYLKEKEPKHFERIRHVLLPHDYLNWWLTGEMRAEVGDASGTGYFDVRKRQWAREALDLIDGGSGQMFEALPSLIASDGIVGTVRAMAAEKLGLSTACVVASGGGDNMMGAIGTGNVREGVVTLSLGTSATVYSFSARPSEDATGAVAAFCSSSGGWLPLVCTMNATNVVTGTVEMLGRTVVSIEPALAATRPGAGEMTFLPFLNGERTPDMPHARGTMLGLSATNFTAEHMIRAAVEGVSFGILNGLDLVLAGKEVEVLQVIGGGARSPGWRQMLADATGAVVRVPAEEEAGCLGAAVQARVAYETSQGRTLGFVEAADDFVRTDADSVTEPRVALRGVYDGARALYNKRLRATYPEAFRGNGLSAVPA